MDAEGGGGSGAEGEAEALERPRTAATGTRKDDFLMGAEMSFDMCLSLRPYYVPDDGRKWLKGG